MRGFYWVEVLLFVWPFAYVLLAFLASLTPSIEAGLQLSGSRLVLLAGVSWLLAYAISIFRPAVSKLVPAPGAHQVKWPT